MCVLNHLAQVLQLRVDDVPVLIEGLFRFIREHLAVVLSDVGCLTTPFSLGQHQRQRG